MSEPAANPVSPPPGAHPAFTPAVALLQVEGLRVTFPTASGSRLTAVDGVSFSLGAGETVGLVGESGCGKTTVARCVVGLQRPDSGRIEVAGRPLGDESRAPVQLVFQDPFSSLNPRLSVRSMLSELILVHRQATKDRVEERCRELLSLVGLPPRALDSYPSAFSGGQRQRLAIARALAPGPRLIVADEPISALDVSVQATILALFERLRAELGIALLLISHNLAAVRQVCDRLAVMYMARIVESGSREEIFDDPRHPYTRALLAAAPRLHPAERLPRAPLRGEAPSPIERPPGCSFNPRCPIVQDRCLVEDPQLKPAGGPGQLAACHFADAPVRLTRE